MRKNQTDPDAMVGISEGLAVAIAMLLAELPAGKTAKMLIELDDAITALKTRVPMAEPEQAENQPDQPAT